MPATFAAVVTDVLRVYPDTTQARILAILAEVDDLIRQLVVNCYLTPHASPVSVAFVAGTKEMALAGLEQVVTVTKDASDQLNPVTVESMTKNNSGWRTVANGVPTDFYITAAADGTMMLGLHPTPSANVTVKVWGVPTRSAYPAVDTEKIPTFQGSRQAYTAGALWLVSREIRPHEEPLRYQTFQQMLQLATGVAATANEPLKGGGDGKNARQ